MAEFDVAKIKPSTPGVAIGEVIETLDSTGLPPKHVLLGNVYSQTAYPELFEAIGLTPDTAPENNATGITTYDGGTAFSADIYWANFATDGKTALMPGYITGTFDAFILVRDPDGTYTRISNASLPNSGVTYVPYGAAYGNGVWVILGRETTGNARQIWTAPSASGPWTANTDVTVTSNTLTGPAFCYHAGTNQFVIGEANGAFSIATDPTGAWTSVSNGTTTMTSSNNDAYQLVSDGTHLVWRSSSDWSQQVWVAQDPNGAWTNVVNNGSYEVYGVSYSDGSWWLSYEYTAGNDHYIKEVTGDPMLPASWSLGSADDTLKTASTYLEEIYRINGTIFGLAINVWSKPDGGSWSTTLGTTYMHKGVLLDNNILVGGRNTYNTYGPVFEISPYSFDVAVDFKTGEALTHAVSGLTYAIRAET